MIKVKGQKIRLMVSDPWSFGEAHGCGPFFGKIIAVHNIDDSINKQGSAQFVLIKLDNPLFFDKQDCQYFLISGRYEKNIVEILETKKAVSCNAVKISEGQALSTQPCNLAKWRGGIALIGTISLD